MRKLISKIINKSLRTLTFIIPHNLKYRPSSVQELQTVDQSLVVTKRIYNSVVTSIEFSKDFHAAMLEKTYDKSQMKKDTVVFESYPQDYYLVKIPNGRLYTDNLDIVAYIDRQNKLLSDVSFQYITKTVSASESKIFKQRFFRKPSRIRENAFAMLSGGLSSRGNYSHWLIDVLPRIHLLEKSGELSKIEKFIVPQFKQEFQKSSLALFNIRPSQIIECDNFTHFEIDNLYVSSHPRGVRSILIPNWVYDFHSEIKEKAKSDRTYPKYIYVTRKDSNLRTIEHEDKLISELSKYGFEAFTLSEYSYQEKINIFDQAEYIVSAHGAGLTNLLYSNPGTKLLEMFSEGFVDPFFLDMAYHKKLEYQYLIFKNPRATYDDQKGQRENVIIDYSLLNKKLEEMLKG